MIKIRVLIITLLLAIMIAPLAAFASDISNAQYYGAVLVSNNSTATTNVATTANISTTNLINGNYLNATATNAVMRNSSGADIIFQPGYTPDGAPWSFWVPSIGANSYLNYILYTANSTGGEIRYFPGSGGMTRIDSASLEPGDNFTIEQKGWIDTDAGADKGLVFKGNDTERAIRARISPTVSGDITSTIYDFYHADDFDTDAWTDVGTKIHVDVGNERLDYESELSAIDERCFYDVGAGVVSDTEWSLDFTWHPISQVGANCNVAFGLWDTAANRNGYAGDAILFLVIQESVRIRQYDGGADTSSALIAISMGTTYYVTLQRTSAIEAVLSVYSDADRTTHIAGSPKTLVVPATVTGLRYLQVSNSNTGVDAGIEEIGWFDDVAASPKLGGVSASATATGISSGVHTVTINGTANQPVWATGNVLNFDGNNDVEMGAIYGAQNNFAVSGWFKTTADFSAASPSDLFIVSNWIDVNNSFRVHLESTNGRLTFNSERLGVDVALTSTATSWSAGEWHHFLAISSNTDGGFLYIDGSLDDTDAGVAWGMAGGGDYFIGEVTDDAGNGFEGVIQNVSTFTDNLTATERSELYQGIVPADAVDYWYLDAGSGPAIASYGTSENEGVADDSDWITSTYTAGRTGRLCDFTIWVDSVRGSGGNVKNGVPNNANGWTFCRAVAMLYLEYQEITIGGVQQQYIEWEYGATFTDQSGQGHHATPTFRTTSSDADVNAELTSFLPISEAKAPDYALGEAPAFIDADALTGNVTSAFGTTPGAGTGTFPLAGVITAMADATDTPAQLPLLIIAVFIILAASLSVSTIMRRHGSGSLFVKIIAIVAFMGIFVALGNFAIEFWMILVFLVIAVAVAFASRQLGWT